MPLHWTLPMGCAQHSPMRPRPAARRPPRIREARTDAFEIRSFRKLASRPSARKPGHMCDFAVEIDTVTGPIAKQVAGRFFAGTWGLAYETAEN